MEISSKEKRLNKEKIIILIPFWGAGKDSFKRIEKIIPQNFGYISYHYTRDILNANPFLTEKNFLEFINRIKSDLDSLGREDGEKKIYIYAQSLGSLFAMILADYVKIEKMALISAGSNLAECFWHGKATRGLKSEMKQKGMTLERLKSIWQNISPDSYFKNYGRGTKIFLKLARNDVYIPYENGIRLLHFLDLEKVSYTCKKNFLTHKIMLLLECIFPYFTLDVFVGK